MPLLMHVRKGIPILSFCLCASLAASFFVLKKQDSVIQQALGKAYIEQGLLQIEQPIYVNFIERRLHIEQIGSNAYLSSVKSAIKASQPDTLIALILSDRFFYPYLLAEGTLFMQPAEYLHWKTLRETHIHPLLDQLGLPRFAFNPQSFQFSRFVSYLWVESSLWYLLVYTGILLLFGGFVEYHLGRGKSALLYLFGTVSVAWWYLILSTEYSPVMQGAAGVCYTLLGASIGHVYLSARESHFFIWWIGGLIAILPILILGLWFQYQGESIDVSGVGAYLLAFLSGSLIYVPLKRWHLRVLETNASNDSAVNNESDWKLRAELALAMDDISAFDFPAARDKLKVLNETYPDSPEVMEQRYQLEKLRPDEADYWECARNLVNYAMVKEDYARMKYLFSDIQRHAPSKKRAKNSLEPDFYHKMMMVFVKHDDLNKAEQAFLFLELAGQKEIIVDACQLLIQEFKIRGITNKQQQYQMLRERL